jgi:hypothetical protein
LQTTLAADAHLAEGQFLLEEKTLNSAVSDIPSRNSATNNFQNGRAEFNNDNNNNLWALQSMVNLGLCSTVSVRLLGPGINLQQGRYLHRIT